MKWLPTILTIIGLICLIGLIGISGKGIVHAASSSKLGIFLLASYKDGSNGGEKIINACPKVVTFYDPQNSEDKRTLLENYKKNCPGGISVIRIHDAIEGKQVDFTKDPAKTADEFSPLILAEVNKIGNSASVDYVSGTNEFENYDDEELVFQEKTEKWQWLGRFWTRLAQNISQAGYKPNIGDINVGHPNVNTAEVLNVLIPTLREVKKLGGAWSYHGYTLDYLMDVGGKTVLENPLHYREFYDHFRKYAPDLLDLPLLITETGVAENGNRLQGFMPDNIEKFKQWLEWYDGELQKDGYVVGATIFQSGDIGQWASFNTDYIAEWLCTKLGGTDCKVSVAEYTGSTSNTTVDKCANKPSKIEELKDRINSLFERNIPKLLRIDKGRLPPVNIELGEALKEDGCPDPPSDKTIQSANLYNIGCSTETPPSETSSLNWWQSFKDRVKDAFSFGNQKAECFMNATLPPNVGNELLSRYRQNDLSMLSQDIGEGAKVLGIFGSRDRAMEVALSVRECGGLPAELCKDNVPGGYSGSGPVPTGQSSPPTSQYPEISPPPGCGQQDSGTEGYTGNACQLVTTGWCSVSCLKQFTKGDIEWAARLSQICMIESGGDPEAFNTSCLMSTDGINNEIRYRDDDRCIDLNDTIRKGCPKPEFDGATRDYSVGLFQVNKLPRCAGGIQDNWNVDKTCTILDKNVLDTCVANNMNPINNIKEALRLSCGGKYWGDWKGASEECGFPIGDFCREEPDWIQ